MSATGTVFTPRGIGWYRVVEPPVPPKPAPEPRKEGA